MSNSFTVKVGESVVEINPDDLKFTDATINLFFERISGKIDYIGRCLANAQRICSLIEQKTELSFINEFACSIDLAVYKSLRPNL